MSNATSAPSRFRLCSLQELASEPPPTWLVDNIILDGSASTLFGPSGEGKTFVALDLALSIATGRAWHGHATRQAPVVYVAGEGVKGLGQRAAAWQQHHGCPGHDFFVVRTAVQLRANKDVTELFSAINGHNLKPGLIVIDTLARSFVGGDENSATDMGELVEAARRIQSEFECAVILVHHTAKKGGAKTQERGSSALRGGMDTMVRVGMSKRVVTISCDKQKDAEHFPALFLNLTSVSLPVRAASGAPATSCVLVDVGAPTLPASSPLTTKQSGALDTLASLGGRVVTTQEWQEAHKARVGSMADRTFYDAIKELVTRGFARKAERGSYQITASGTATANVLQTPANSSVATLLAATAHTPVGGVRVQHGLQNPDQAADVREFPEGQGHTSMRGYRVEKVDGMGSGDDAA